MPDECGVACRSEKVAPRILDPPLHTPVCHSRYSSNKSAPWLVVVGRENTAHEWRDGKRNRIHWWLRTRPGTGACRFRRVRTVTTEVSQRYPRERVVLFANARNAGIVSDPRLGLSLVWPDPVISTTTDRWKSPVREGIEYDYRYAETFTGVAPIPTRARKQRSGAKRRSLAMLGVRRN